MSDPAITSGYRIDTRFETINMDTPRLNCRIGRKSAVAKRSNEFHAEKT
jgi:hypothetical protein